MTARLLIVVITVIRKARRLRRQYVLKSTFRERPAMSVSQSEIVPEVHLKALVAAAVITPVGAEGTFADNVKEKKVTPAFNAGFFINGCNPHGASERLKGV